MQEFEIIFYDKPDGTEPVKEFLDSLDVKMRAKTLRTVLLYCSWQRTGHSSESRIPSLWMTVSLN